MNHLGTQFTFDGVLTGGFDDGRTVDSRTVDVGTVDVTTSDNRRGQYPFDTGVLGVEHTALVNVEHTLVWVAG